MVSHKRVWAQGLSISQGHAVDTHKKQHAALENHCVPQTLQAL